MLTRGIFVICRYSKEVPKQEIQCRCMPFDACWPSDTEWSKFNKSVGGRLERTIPIGSPCHDPVYDEERCEYLKSHWTLPNLQYAKNLEMGTPD